jgi:hypothetical protein
MPCSCKNRNKTKQPVKNNKPNGEVNNDAAATQNNIDKIKELIYGM